MSKEALEIEMNYPPTVKVDVWMTGDDKGWKEAVVVERVTTETVSANQVKWRLKLKGDGSYTMETWVHETQFLRLRMDGVDGVANRVLLDNFAHYKRVNVLS